MATTAPKRALLQGKRVLRYLKRTEDVGIWFKPTEVENVTAFGDASFAIKKSQMGTVVKLGDNIISWRSSKQPQVAKSTADNDVTAMASTAMLGELVKAFMEIYVDTYSYRGN